MTNYRFWIDTQPTPTFLLYIDWPEWQRPQLGQQLTLPLVTGDQIWKVVDIDPIQNPPGQLVDYFLEQVVYDPSVDPMKVLEGYEED